MLHANGLYMLHTKLCLQNCVLFWVEVLVLGRKAGLAGLHQNLSEFSKDIYKVIRAFNYPDTFGVIRWIQLA